MRNATHDKMPPFILAILNIVSVIGLSSCGENDAHEKKAVLKQDTTLREQPPGESAVKSANTGSGDKCSTYVKSLSNHDWRMRKKAAEQLELLGKEAEGAIPALIKALFDKDDEVRTAASAALGSVGAATVLPLTEMIERVLGTEVYDERIAVELTEDEWNSVSHAAGALKKIGSEARGAAGVLMRIIKSKCKDPREMRSCWTAQGTASDALSRIGAGAVPVLISALNTRDPATRAEAAKALGNIGKDAAEAVPVLANMLMGEQSSTCEAAAVALSGIGEPAIPTLLSALHEKRPMVREPAVKALIRMGPPAKEAVPELKKMLGDSKRWTRRAAEDVLDRLR
jgi:HEAT repeat protein